MKVTIATMLIFAMPSIALAAPDFVVVAQKINPVMEPKNPGDAFADCTKDPICSQLADAAASYLGVPPGTLAAASAIFSAKREGEEGRYQIRLPSGYQYCHATIKTKSVVPASGDRASAMGASTNKDGVNVYTWTGKQGVGGPRSWVDADYTVYGVRDEIADQQRAAGKCTPYGKTIIDCRGAKGTNKGRPACGTVSN